MVNALCHSTVGRVDLSGHDEDRGLLDKMFKDLNVVSFMEIQKGVSYGSQPWKLSFTLALTGSNNKGWWKLYSKCIMENFRVSQT